MLIKPCPGRGVRNKPACVILVSILSYKRVVFNDFQTFYVETAGGSPLCLPRLGKVAAKPTDEVPRLFPLCPRTE